MKYVKEFNLLRAGYLEVCFLQIILSSNLVLLNVELKFEHFYSI